MFKRRSRRYADHLAVLVDDVRGSIIDCQATHTTTHTEYEYRVFTERMEILHVDESEIMIDRVQEELDSENNH